MGADRPMSRQPFFAREAGVLWVLWLTYGSFYFCRNNLAVALPGIQSELGYTKSELGTVLMALKLTYGIGQFINGQLAERVSPRLLLAAGVSVNIRSQPDRPQTAAGTEQPLAGTRALSATASDGATPLLVATLRAQVPLALFLRSEERPVFLIQLLLVSRG